MAVLHLHLKMIRITGKKMNHGTRAWYKHIQHELKPKDKDGIFSMSGWTRTEFGYPFPE